MLMSQQGLPSSTELREKLTECAKVAAQNANISAAKYKSYFDLKSQDRSFNSGDEVLILLPDESSSKLLLSWRCPFKVLEKRHGVKYLIDKAGKQRLYHIINLLKKYHRRAQVTQVEDKPSLTNYVFLSIPASSMKIQRWMIVKFLSRQLTTSRMIL